jgi:hypothetical protein
MATIKNIPDSYTINVPTMTVNGNLNITGNTTTFHSNNLSVDDNIITLNGNVSGTPTLNAGIQVNRGSSANVLIQWTEASKAWQITNNGTTFGNIVYAPAGNITLNANLYLQTTAVVPASLAGNIALYAGTVGAGGSGLYVVNTVYNNEEIALKRRAIAYSIIFGS